MLNTLHKIITGWFSAAVKHNRSSAIHGNAELVSTQAEDSDQPIHTLTAGFVPYDENLLERTRTQWQFGDWESLSMLERDTLQHHPDRAKLALLAAAGHLQKSNMGMAKKFICLAQEWGCNKKQLSQILIAGVHNSLAKAAAMTGQRPRQIKHYELALGLVTPGADKRLLIQARINEESLEQKSHLIRVVKKEALAQSLKPTSTTTTKSENVNFGGDAQIDDFLNDIAPFLSSRAITYVDIGAYVGEVFMKISKSKKLNMREAHLFEPNPESYQILRSNIKDSQVTSLHAYNSAVGNEKGSMSFLSAKSMTKRFQHELLANPITNTFETKCTSLDQLTGAFTDGRIDLLKIDVEGEEADVLSSASDLLHGQKIDIVYIEVGLNREGTQQAYLADIDMLLQDFGYRLFKIYEQKNEWIQDSPLLRRCNAAYMSSKFAEANPYKLTLENYQLKQELKNFKAQL